MLRPICRHREFFPRRKVTTQCRHGAVLFASLLPIVRRGVIALSATKIPPPSPPTDHFHGSCRMFTFQVAFRSRAGNVHILIEISRRLQQRNSIIILCPRFPQPRSPLQRCGVDGNEGRRGSNGDECGITASRLSYESSTCL